MSQLSEQTDVQTDTYSMASSPKTGPNPTQKKILGISAATLLLGGAAWAITQDKSSPGSTIPSNGLPKTGTTQLPEDVDVAQKVTETMTFEQAFEAARTEVGIGGIFGWHGHWYNTFEKEEWSSLSLEQRQEFTEMITQEHLPVKPYGVPHTHAPETHMASTPEPTIIEGHINGQRVMGLDFDRDGIIDTLIMEGSNGSTYKIVDAHGDNGMDTLLRYDSFTGELIAYEKLDESFILSNDQFSHGLEASMSKEVVDSILEPEITAPATPEMSNESGDDEPALEEEQYLADSHEPDDDTYINNGDVHDMDDQ
ncbi:hypothetical protein [Spirosoma aerophilum]